jgi:large subunit ribosomal protein L25
LNVYSFPILGIFYRREEFHVGWKGIFCLKIRPTIEISLKSLRYLGRGQKKMTSSLQAVERTEFRNSALTKIRREGNIPAVVYGNKLESKSVYINGADFIKTMREVGRNGVFPIDLNGKQVNVMLTDYQADPIKNEIVHADLLAVDMSKEITADVRITLVGEALGVKDGGVMQQSLHEVSVTATPSNIPQALEVDVSSLQVGETITIGDIKQSRNFEINHEDEQTVVSILPPKAEEEIDSGEEQEEGIPDNEEGRETEPESTEA